MIYTADFGPDYSTASAGVTEYSSAGAVVVARTTTGITHVANGLFLRDFTPDVATKVLTWDAEGVYASETLPDNTVIAAAVLAAAEASPIHSDARKMNGSEVTGTGTALDKWRGV